MNEPSLLFGWLDRYKKVQKKEEERDRLKMWLDECVAVCDQGHGKKVIVIRVKVSFSIPVGLLLEKSQSFLSVHQ